MLLRQLLQKQGHERRSSSLLQTKCRRAEVLRDRNLKCGVNVSGGGDGALTKSRKKMKKKRERLEGFRSFKTSKRRKQRSEQGSKQRSNEGEDVKTQNCLCEKNL